MNGEGKECKWRLMSEIGNPLTFAFGFWPNMGTG
jgi:hypothetical protein